ncbi:MAG TPA: M56 family metallopeptidase [Saprospiraceae bacterium]|nr:M56 family metallopeptidase [Saprospiraceae bacterium]HPI06448.1 M56 family metallopeptidase [Saprospiraceae bacterium]
METLFFSVPEQLAQALGWMVLHSIWQAALIALATGLLLIVLRRYSARARYWVANAALLAILLSAACTFGYYYRQPANLPSVTVENAPVLNPLPHSAAPFKQADQAFPDTIGRDQTVTAYFNRNLPLIVALWFLGLCIFLLRLSGNIGYVYYLKNHLNFPAEEYWDDLLQKLLQKSRLHAPVQLLESALVRSPMVIGYLKPVILFPIGLINRLDPENVEAILAHELAHIVHRDYLFNLLQSMVETLFYYHPAVWWLSARVRHEREIAADDAAVRLTGNAIGYAKSLVLIQDLAWMPLSAAPAFAGDHKNQLLRRIQHILHVKQSTNLAMEKIIGTCAILLVIIGLGFAQNKNTPQYLHERTEMIASGNTLAGIWEGKIDNDKVCITLSSRSDHNSWMNGNCYPKSDFSALPTVESEFTLTRPAGTVTFKGKFENNEGYGRFRFNADATFSSWLQEQGISGIDEEAMVHLFFANIDKDYVLSLKKAGYNKISGEDLQNLAIQGVDRKRIDEVREMSKDLGAGDPSIETIVNLTIHDINKDYVKSLSQAGFTKLSLDDVMNARIHEITPEYVKQVRAMGFGELSFEDVLNFKIHEITPEFLSGLKKSGITPLSAEEALNLRIHDLSPEAIAEFQKMGFNGLSTEDMMNLKIHDVSPEFLNEMRKAGFDNLSAEDALNLKIQDVSPEFVKEMEKAGFKNLVAEEAMNLKIHGITPEFIQKMAEAGFKNLSIDEALNLKIHDVNPADLAAYSKLGFTKINVDDAVSLKIHEVTPEFIQSMRNKGFTDLELEDYVNLKVQYGSKIKK